MGCCHFAFNFVANDFRMVLSTENNGSDYICASVVDVSLEWLHSYAYTYASIKSVYINTLDWAGHHSWKRCV